jgi:hypothetical protein
MVSRAVPDVPARVPQGYWLELAMMHLFSIEGGKQHTTSRLWQSVFLFAFVSVLILID